MAHPNFTAVRSQHVKHTKKHTLQNATQTEENQQDDTTMNCNKTKTTETKAQITNNQQHQKEMTARNKMVRTTTAE
jgi:hypothetical protein